EVFETVAAATRDSDAHVRLAALALLSSSFATTEGAGSLMLERLDSDHDVGVRRAAAIALGSLPPGTPAAIEALGGAACQTVDESLARAARTSLERLTRS